MSKFSGAVVLADLNDFISPSQNCIKPVEVKKTADTDGEAQIKIESDGTYVEVDIKSGIKSKLETAKITLNDCLACSGCVTSAETVLIQMQSQEELYKVLTENQKLIEEGRSEEIKVIVVSISPQSRASFSAKYKLTPLQVAKKLTNFFRKLGVHHVFDTSFSRDFALMESQTEFVKRFKSNSKMPMMASACPGWICYAEKTHGSYILPYISSTKSPQQIMGILVKEYLGEKLSKKPNQIYHVTVMPCYDKKLEASRDDFYSDLYRTRDVDCVLTTGEVEVMLSEKSTSMELLEEARLDTLLSKATSAGTEERIYGSEGGGSGGYLEHIFRYAAKNLYGVEVQEIEYKAQKNNDFKEITLEMDGRPVLKFALAYGFKNIQNLVRKIKIGKSPYHFVEVMACPSGCNNGGGQLKPFDGETPKELLARVEQNYEQVDKMNPEENPVVSQIYQEWIGERGSEKAVDKFHTHYHAVEKTLINPLTVQW